MTDAGHGLELDSQDEIQIPTPMSNVVEMLGEDSGQKANWKSSSGRTELKINSADDVVTK